MLNKEVLNNQLISRRAFFIGIGKIGLLSLLSIRMLYMQLFKNNEYKTLSDKNRINLVFVPPFRGCIYDVNGNIIATNKSYFKLLLDRNINNNYQNELTLVINILGLSEEKQAQIRQKIKKTHRRTPITILDYLDWQQLSLIEEQKLNLSSIFIDMGYSRFYPIAESICHVIGYTGQINEQEKQELGINSISDLNVGKFGIEKYYEKKLCGDFGYKKVEVNAFGKQVREISAVASKQGDDLILNIDATLQQKIQPYLNKQGCSAIVMDCTNGNVLILASAPMFISNNFSKLSHNYWQSLINDQYKPLINKTVQSTYSPGSIFKIITILAALEFGIKPNKIVNCHGSSVLGNNSFRCSRIQGHGAIDMLSAIKYSCNSYIYELSCLIGSDRIIEMARKFGFGNKTGIDLLEEVPGFLPSREWKKRKLKSQWTIGDTLNLSIGQGFLLITPIQLAQFASAIASNGKLYVPRIAKDTTSLFQQVNINQKHLDVLKNGMYNAVNTVGGTAYYNRIISKDYQLAGKTGTVQVKSKINAKDDLNRDSIAWEKRNHAVFLGFAPYHNPRYSIIVFVDHGGGGGRAAAPIASKIMTNVLDKYA